MNMMRGEEKKNDKILLPKIISSKSYASYLCDGQTDRRAHIINELNEHVIQQLAKGRLTTDSKVCGVFLVKTKNAFVPVKCVFNVSTYSRILIVPRASEPSE